MTQGEYVAAVYAVVFAVVLLYVAIIAAKLVRLQRQTSELLELAERKRREPADVQLPQPPAAERRAEAT